MIAQDVMLLAGDIDRAFFERALESGQVACDIETTGLDWRSARICTVQVATAGEIIVVQLRQKEIPGLLARLLAAPGA